MALLVLVLRVGKVVLVQIAVPQLGGERMPVGGEFGTNLADQETT